MNMDATMQVYIKPDHTYWVTKSVGAIAIDPPLPTPVSTYGIYIYIMFH